MLCLSLNSGSNGNCYYIRTEKTKILIDAGISGKKVRERLYSVNEDTTGIDGLFISHDHRDHICSAGIYTRMFDIPLFVTRNTYSCGNGYLGSIKTIEHFKAGEIISIGDLTVQTIKTPHDGADPVMFIVSNMKHRVGIFTDLGHCFPHLLRAISTLDIIFIESNYDDEMLKNNREYPEVLKRRIRSSAGHISNFESANIIRAHASSRLKYVVLSHLSENNNTPTLAYNTHKMVYGNRYDISIAPRDTTGKVLAL